MKSIPLALIYLRLLIGVILIIFSLEGINYYEIIVVILVSIGLVSDIFDGIIARHLNVSSKKLRRLDSTVDQIFWCLVVISTFIHSPDFFNKNYIQLIALIGIEALTYLVSFAKFRKEVATHAIASKIWTLTLFATLLQLIYMGDSHILFQICFYIGIITRLEILTILLLLRSWTNDVPSVYHAVRLRQGKTIQRNKLFNG
ncbi:CDP-alcohol phosphatidyltransferase family protein [Rubrolithibacter danxiaensis]|uniref:CDP-alcohol phosphatidyltransferase family protein n=1 Tax=Rubrolithibacter danxiaensis TaxID=3390805 RepID=UPI003BF7B932